MSVQIYSKGLVLFVLVLLLGFVFGAWSVAAVWRIGVIVAVAIMIIERIRAMRRRSGIS